MIAEHAERPFWLQTRVVENIPPSTDVRLLFAQLDHAPSERVVVRAAAQPEHIPEDVQRSP